MACHGRVFEVFKHTHTHTSREMKQPLGGGQLTGRAVCVHAFSRACPSRHLYANMCARLNLDICIMHQSVPLCENAAPFPGAWFRADKDSRLKCIAN